jgi:hypothetical protein
VNSTIIIQTIIVLVSVLVGFGLAQGQKNS